MPTDVWNEYKDKIAGGWQCIAFEVLDSPSPDAKVVFKPHGDTPLGRVLISPTGYLSSHTAEPRRCRSFVAEGHQVSTAPDASVAHLTRGYGMYCGPMELFRDDDGALWWQTRPEISCDPSRIGRLEKRKVKWWQEGERQFMALEPFDDVWGSIRQWQGEGGGRRSVVTWEKFE